MKIDKVVMNVSQSAFAQGSTALDLMKKAPGVTVDKDGNVKLNGKSVSIWIDGRPSYMSGKSLESLLRSTNGESIDKFELMEHPSSKYDAEGQGGIINIKTKKNLKQGFNGSLGLGGGGMYFSNIDELPFQESAWTNLAFRTKNTNSFLNVSENNNQMPIELINDLNIGSTNPANAFEQHSTSLLLYKHFTYNVKFGTDWFVNDKNTLGFIVYVPGATMTQHAKTSTTEQYTGGQLTETSRSQILNGPTEAVQHNVNLNYTHIFDEARGAEITANADYYHNSSDSYSGQTDTTRQNGYTFLGKKSMTSEQIYDIYSAKADYQTVLAKKFMLEAGAKWALSHNDNNSLETESKIPSTNPVREEKQFFIYNEHVGAAYASLAGQFGPKWSFKAGLRGEYTNSFGDWKSSGEQTHRDYFDLFPTAYVGYTPSEKWRLSASYTRRIERPGYSQLNPTKSYIDAKTYTCGNPDILPQYTDEASFSVGFGQHLSLSLGASLTNNTINQIPTYSTDGIQYLTWGNLGKQNIGYAAFSAASLPLSKWLYWTLSANGLYLNSSNNLSGIVHNCLAAQAYTDFTFVLPKDWKIDLDAQYQSPLTLSIYHTHTSFVSNLAVMKNMLENKLTLTFRIDDIFRSSNNNIDIVDESGVGAVTQLKQLYYSQSFILDLTWNFGTSQKPAKKRNVGNLEEMSRVSNGSAGINK